VFDSGYLYQATSVNNNQALKAASSSQAGGQVATASPSSGDSLQRFMILPSGSDWKIALAANTGICLDDNGQNANGAPVYEQSCGNATNQTFAIADDGAGHFKIMLKATGAYLSVGYSGGLELDGWNANGLSADRQTWKIRAVNPSSSSGGSGGGSGGSGGSGGWSGGGGSGDGWHHH
jgi:hypothetical protein